VRTEFTLPFVGRHRALLASATIQRTIHQGVLLLTTQVLPLCIFIPGIAILMPAAATRLHADMYMMPEWFSADSVPHCVFL
jgi:hypothetical protein